MTHRIGCFLFCFLSPCLTALYSTDVFVFFHSLPNLLSCTQILIASFCGPLLVHSWLFYVCRCSGYLEQLMQFPQHSFHQLFLQFMNGIRLSYHVIVNILLFVRHLLGTKLSFQIFLEPESFFNTSAKLVCGLRSLIGEARKVFLDFPLTRGTMKILFM